MQHLGFTLDGVDIPALLTPEGGQFVIARVGGRNLLAPEASLTRSLGRDGSRFIEASLPPREITIEYSVIGDHKLDTARRIDLALAGSLVTREPRRLAFSDQGVRWYEAILTSANLRQAGETWYSGQLVFTCPRPFLYGSLVQAEISEQYSAQTNYFVEPVWTVQMGAAAPAGFVLTVGGSRFEYSGALASSARVVINSARRETRVDGALRVPEISGAYPVLEAHSAIALSVPGIVGVDYQARWV